MGSFEVPLKRILYSFLISTHGGTLSYWDPGTRSQSLIHTCIGSISPREPVFVMLWASARWNVLRWPVVTFLPDAGGDVCINLKH